MATNQRCLPTQMLTGAMIMTIGIQSEHILSRLVVEQLVGSPRIGVSICDVMMVNVDNQGAMALVRNPVFHNWYPHSVPRHH